MVDFDDLDTNPNAPKPQMTAEEIKQGAHIANGGEAVTSFACPKCGGRGYRVYGYVNITSYPCNYCRRTGKVTQKRVDNIERAIKADRTRQMNDGRFREEHAELIEALNKIREWHTFAASLLDQLDSGKRWSERQIEAAQRSVEKVEAKRQQQREERAKANDAKSGDVDISAITALFATATDNDIKRPVFRADGLTISKAPMHGRNAGALYVKSNDDLYLGKIVNGKFMAARDATADTLAKLQAVAADPTAEAIKYARRTGRCGCCGKTLVDPVSIRAGIGPICAQKWGLDYRRELAREELNEEKEQEAR